MQTDYVVERFGAIVYKVYKNDGVIIYGGCPDKGAILPGHIPMPAVASTTDSENPYGIENDEDE